MPFPLSEQWSGRINVYRFILVALTAIVQNLCWPRLWLFAPQPLRYAVRYSLLREWVLANV